MIWAGIIIVSFLFVLVLAEVFADAWALVSYARRGRDEGVL